MIIQKLYLNTNDQGKTFLSFSPDASSSNLIFLRLIAEEGKYLYNIKEGMIDKAVTIPSFLKSNWEERTY